jgi:hypothetical protein
VAAKTEVASDASCKKGVLWGLKKVCSPATTGEEKTWGDVAEEDRGVAAREEVCTAGAAEEEVMGGCSIAEEVMMKVF